MVRPSAPAAPRRSSRFENIICAIPRQARHPFQYFGLVLVRAYVRSYCRVRAHAAASCRTAPHPVLLLSVAVLELLQQQTTTPVSVSEHLAATGTARLVLPVARLQVVFWYGNSPMGRYSAGDTPSCRNGRPPQAYYGPDESSLIYSWLVAQGQQAAGRLSLAGRPQRQTASHRSNRPTGLHRGFVHGSPRLGLTVDICCSSRGRLQSRTIRMIAGRQDMPPGRVCHSKFRPEQQRAPCAQMSVKPTCSSFASPIPAGLDQGSDSELSRPESYCS